LQSREMRRQESWGDQAVQSEVLEGLAMAKNHRKWFVAFATPYLGDDADRGERRLGDYAAEWLVHAPRMTLTEADPGRLVALKERSPANRASPSASCCCRARRPARHAPSSRTTCSNTSGTTSEPLRTMRSLVRPGGHVISLVPAFPVRDEPGPTSHRPRPRYTRRTMRAAMTQAELEIDTLRYANSLGLIGYYVSTSLLRQTPAPGPWSSSTIRWWHRRPG